MQRRKFITLIGVTAATWPFKARSQQPAPVIGFLGSRSREESTNEVAAFLRGLSEAGYVEGQGVVVEYLWADIQYEKLPALAAELVARHVSVIAATGGPVSGLAVKATTTTIPIVFISGGDPVKLGLVASLNRPGGNATGVNLFITAIEGKRLGLLHELVPAATAIAVILNPNSPEYEMQLTDVQVAAHIIQVQLQILMAGNEGEVVAAFSTLARGGAKALLVCADPFFSSVRERLVSLAASYSVCAIYETKSYTAVGGLMSYGPNLPDMYRQVGKYVAQIIKGAKPSDLPVVQPTVLELVVNLKTARSLGLTIPSTLLARADEVIE